MGLYFALLIRNVYLKEAMKFSAEFGSYFPGLFSTRDHNPAVPIPKSAASNWSNLPALKWGVELGTNQLWLIGGIGSSSVLGQAPLDAAAGGGESSQGMGAEVVPAKLAVVWDWELKRPWHEEEKGWQGSGILRVWGTACLSSLKTRIKRWKVENLWQEVAWMINWMISTWWYCIWITCWKTKLTEILFRPI